MSLREDQFGCVSRGERMRALFGNRVTHGKARQSASVPPVVAAPDNPKLRMAPPFIIPTIITADLMSRADALADGAAELQTRLEASVAVATEIEEALAVLSGEKQEPQPPRKIHHARILDAVSSAFGISIEDMKGPRRHQPYAQARFAFWRLARRHSKLSTPVLGQILGDRDHTCVLNGCRRAEDLMANNPAWRAKYDAAEILVTAEN